MAHSHKEAAGECCPFVAHSAGLGGVLGWFVLCTWLACSACFVRMRRARDWLALRTQLVCMVRFAGTRRARD